MIFFGDHQERGTFYVTTLASHSIILGHDWLVHHNPEINWRTGQVHMRRCPKACRKKKDSLPIIIEEEEEDMAEDAMEDIRATCGMAEGERLFATTLWGSQPEEVNAAQRISQ